MTGPLAGWVTCELIHGMELVALVERRRHLAVDPQRLGVHRRSLRAGRVSRPDVPVGASLFVHAPHSVSGMQIGQPLGLPLPMRGPQVPTLSVHAIVDPSRHASLVAGSSVVDAQVGLTGAPEIAGVAIARVVAVRICAVAIEIIAAGREECVSGAAEHGDARSVEVAAGRGLRPPRDPDRCRSRVRIRRDIRRRDERDLQARSSSPPANGLICWHR